MSGLIADPAQWLPVVFAALMGLSILVYVILDGFDLGVGLLSPLAPPVERDRMVASIGPFWDANETWLVLAIGLLLVAFPAVVARQMARTAPDRVERWMPSPFLFAIILAARKQSVSPSDQAD